MFLKVLVQSTEVFCHIHVDSWQKALEDLMSVCVITSTESFHLPPCSSCPFSRRWQIICYILVVTLKHFPPFSFVISGCEVQPFQKHEVQRMITLNGGQIGEGKGGEVTLLSTKSSVHIVHTGNFKALTRAFFMLILEKTKFIYWQHSSGAVIPKISSIYDIEAWLCACL